MFRDSAPLIRDAILLRYRMTPYLYSAEYEANQTGAPIMRALVYEFQNDEKVYDESFEFLFGRDILVANVIEPGAKTKKVYLPSGCRWYDWNDKFRCYEGGQTIEVPVGMETIPMFIREGAIIPMADNQLMSMERDHTTALHLILAPGRESSYTLYDDDGVSNDFRRGVYRKTEIAMTGESVVKVAFRSEGSYADTVETVTVEMIRKDRSPFWVALGSEKLPHFLNRRHYDAAACGWYSSQTKRAVLIIYPNPKKDVQLSVSFEDFDLIGM
jgi:alpha-glucosidase